VGWCSHLLNHLHVEKNLRQKRRVLCLLRKPSPSSSIQDVLALGPVKMAFILLGWIAPLYFSRLLSTRYWEIRRNLKKKKSQVCGHHSPMCRSMHRASECPFTWISVRPGFGWDSIGVPPGSWCSAVFWICNENNVGNILMFSVIAKKSRSFQLLMLPGGRGRSRDSRPKLAEGMCHAVGHQGQCAGWGSWLGRGDRCLGTGWVSVIGC